VVANLVLGNFGANFGHTADNLMAGDAGVDCVLPLVASLVDVGVADAAKENLNFNISLAWLASSDVHRGEGVLGGGGSESADSRSAHKIA
jgi:hypothetical protein